MADTIEGVAIDQLPPATDLTGGEQLPIVQDNETRHATIDDVADRAKTKLIKYFLPTDGGDVTGDIITSAGIGFTASAAAYSRWGSLTEGQSVYCIGGYRSAAYFTSKAVNADGTQPTGATAFFKQNATSDANYRLMLSPANGGTNTYNAFDLSATGTITAIVSGVSYKFYSSLNPPTAADTGAVPLKFGTLPAVVDASLNDMLPVLQNGVNKYATLDVLKPLLSGGISGIKINSYGNANPSEFKSFYNNALISAKPTESTADIYTVLWGSKNVTSSIVRVPAEHGFYVVAYGLGVLANNLISLTVDYVNDEGVVTSLVSAPIDRDQVITQMSSTSVRFNSTADDDLSKSPAHGKRNGYEYWKHTMLIDSAGGLVRYAPSHTALLDIPCDADGNPLHYTLHTEYYDSYQDPAFLVMLTVYGDATQLLDVKTGVYTPISTKAPGFKFTYWY